MTTHENRHEFWCLLKQVSRKRYAPWINEKIVFENLIVKLQEKKSIIFWISFITSIFLVFCLFVSSRAECWLHFCNWRVFCGSTVRSKSIALRDLQSGCSANFELIRLTAVPCRWTDEYTAGCRPTAQKALLLNLSTKYGLCLITEFIRENWANF